MPQHEFFKISATGGRFIRFSNTDGKRWIMPLRDMLTAMNLYQPSGGKGRLVKSLLPYVYRLPFVGRVIYSEFVNIEMEAAIHQQIAQAVGVDNFRFAIFEGTPSVHKKATIQIWHRSEILAYCKVSDNDQIRQLFERESITLTRLHEAGVTQIPRSLFCGTIGSNHVFIQSTTKTNRSQTAHQWTQQHWDFLTLLHEKTKIKCRFEDSDLAKSLISLEGYFGYLSQEHAATISRAIDIVRINYGGREVEFSAYHGDFTPWNMFVERNKLFVFDFEYSSSSCPPYMDMFHFVNQVAIIEKQYHAFSVYEYVIKQTGMYCSNNRDFNTIYLSYLLYIISFYYGIGSRNFGPNDNGYCQWLNVIKIIIKLYNQ